jgi:hypothetical protein
MTHTTCKMVGKLNKASKSRLHWEAQLPTLGLQGASWYITKPPPHTW